jgi:hypothetical protein
MSSPAQPDKWIDDALKHGAEWSKVRENARVVIRAMGWRDEAPPPGRAVYVRGG